jgi:two-component system cell cycle sensor histidine kinase/response regulator CckA
MSVPLPPNERGRLEALRRQAILDTPPEAAFDRISRLAARLLEVPIALVSFIDERRQWYKARYGANWQEVGRESSVCAYTILTDGLTVVPDLSRDRRFADNPQVTGPSHLRFYAGAPLKSSDGFNIGTLCAIDTQSRDFSLKQRETLGDLAALTADELRLRLASAEGRLASIVESCVDAVVSKSLDGIIMSWNEAATCLFGYAPEEIVGKPVSLLIPPNRPDEEAQILARLKRGERVSHFETVRRCKDGRLIDVSVTISPIRDGNGRIVGASKVARDITDRKKVEARLRESEERFQQLAENVDEIFWIWDWERGRVVYVSPAYEAVCGRSCQSLYQAERRALLDTIHPEDRERILRVGANQRDASYKEEFRIMRPDGEVRWIRAGVFPVRDPGAQIKRAVGTARDITADKLAAAELRHLAEQLREAQKMEALGRLACGVAHDFNNLLSVVFGHSALLALGSPSPERLHDSAAQISRAAERAAAVTRQLLAFGRRQVVEPKVLDLNAIVTDAAGMLMRLLGEEVQVSTKLQPDLRPVRVDPGEMDQVILNLALNARDAMAQGGRLTLETQEVELDEVSARAQADLEPGRYVVLAVSDTGRGMTPETQAHIFEPFFTTKGVGHGTGLGLSVVHGILKQHGGHIAVQSQLDLGTTFKIYLPASDGPVEGPAEVVPSKPVQGGETVLLVEDEEPVREVAALMLLSLGYRVLKASNGEEALRVVEAGRERVDLLMTDVVMPDMGGRDLADALQTRLPGLKVLFQSGYTGDTVIRQGILHTDVAFLQKPFTLEALSRKLREVLDRDGSD